MNNHVEVDAAVMAFLSSPRPEIRAFAFAWIKLREENDSLKADLNATRLELRRRVKMENRNTAKDGA